MTVTAAFLRPPHPTIRAHDVITCIALKLGGDMWKIGAAGTPVNGVAGTGTGADWCGIGSEFTDTTSGNLYLNAGTKSSPVWKLVTRAA